MALITKLHKSLTVKLTCIKYNTLGKLKRHGQQMKFIRAFTGMEENVDYLTDELEEVKTRANKAVTIIEKNNLKVAHIVTGKQIGRAHV